MLIAVSPALGFGILYGLRTPMLYGALLAVMVASLGLGLVSGNLDLGLLTLQATGISAMLAEGSRRSWSGPVTLLACFAFLVWTFVLSIYLVAGADFVTWYNGLMDALGKELESALRQYGQISGSEKELERWLPQLKKELTRLFPGFFGLSLAAISFVNVSVAALVTRLFWGKSCFVPNFEQWKFPEALVWFVIAAGALALFGPGGYQNLGVNALYVIGFFYFIQGLAIANFLIKKMRMPWYVKWPVYILILIQWYGLLMLALGGLADVWIDFRARFEPEENGDDRPD